MRTGLAFIAVGVFAALVGQNVDSYVMAGIAVLAGVSMLRVKGL
jgi:hypothetical protein